MPDVLCLMPLLTKKSIKKKYICVSYEGSLLCAAKVRIQEGASSMRSKTAHRPIDQKELSYKQMLRTAKGDHAYTLYISIKY